MRTKDLDEDLRRAINQYLSNNYGTQLPADKDYVIDERNDYLYMNTDNGNVFYIPKAKVNKIIESNNNNKKKDDAQAAS